MEIKSNWEKTAKRFVAYFDIMGFKDLVQRNSHDLILQKLESLKKVLKNLEAVSPETNKEFKKLQAEQFQTRSVTFSDSIIFFSKADSLPDLQKIATDAYSLVTRAIKEHIGIKGVLSYGEITVDFENYLFFGQPIIDAYLLHEDLMLYTTALDCSFEAKLKSMTTTLDFPDSILTSYKVPLKSGKATHQLIKPQKQEICQKMITNLVEMYSTVSGRPRIYIDNTIEFLESLAYRKQDE